MGSPKANNPIDISKLTRFEEQYTKVNEASHRFFKMKPILFDIEKIFINDIEIVVDDFEESKFIIDFSNQEAVIRFAPDEHRTAHKKISNYFLTIKFEDIPCMEITSTEQILSFEAKKHTMSQTFQENLRSVFKSEACELNALQEDFELEEDQSMLLKIHLIDSEDFTPIHQNENVLNKLVVSKLKFFIDGHQFKLKSTPKFNTGEKFYPTPANLSTIEINLRNTSSSAFGISVSRNYRS